MALQSLTQRIEPPAPFGTLLSASAQQTPRPSLTPAQLAEVAENFAGYEKILCKAEKLTAQFEAVVEFARQAGQDDETARAFDRWTESYGPAGFFDACEETLAPGLNRYADNFNKDVEGWQRIAAAGVIGPELPLQLAERIVQLDARIEKLTKEVIKIYDNDLVARLLMRVGKQRQLTLDEQLRLADAVTLEWKVLNEPSLRRADWYGADGQ